MPVYMIRCGDAGPVKIGKADDPQSRLRDLQTSHHEELVLLRLIDGSDREEKALHRHFAHQHIRGEWFHFREDMLTVDATQIVSAETKAFKVMAVGDPVSRAKDNGRDAALMKAIQFAGGTTELARLLGINSQAVSQWKRVPASRVIAVETATHGAVSRSEMRPDLYPTRPELVPA